jgi:hypothetical protein
MHKLTKADEEISGFFTSAIGVKAQCYDTDARGGFDGEAMASGWLRSKIDWYDRVAATLRQLPSGDRRVLELVYEPYGADQIVAIALGTPWGHGSFVRMASTSGIAMGAFLKRYPSELAPQPARLLEFFEREARRGNGAGMMFKRLRDECEETRRAALTAYDELRIARARDSATTRAAKRAAVEAENEALLEQKRRERHAKHVSWIERQLRGAS